MFPPISRSSWLAAGGLLLSLWLPAAASGTIFSTTNYPVLLPSQQAFLHYKNGTQTLIVQSQYQQTSPSPAQLAWVCPVPAVPERATMQPDEARRLFMLLNLTARQPVARFGNNVIGLLMIIPLALVTLARNKKTTSEPRKHRRKAALVVCFISMAAGVLFTPFMTRPEGTELDTLKNQHDANLFDITVLPATDSSALTDWLAQNHFKYTKEKIDQLIHSCPKSGAYVIAKMNPSDESEPIGTTPPLVLRFKTEVPQFITAGPDTTTLLYVASEQPVRCKKKLPLHYAKPVPGDHLYGQPQTTPADFFRPSDLQIAYLSKFKGRSNAAQEIEFQPTKRKRPYAKHLIRW